MLNAYKQVAMTYFTRPAMWLVTPIFVALVALGLWKVRGQDIGMFLVPLAGVMVLMGITAGSHLRHQFANPAVYLAPRYARTHLGVAVAGYLIACFGATAGLAWWWGVSGVYATAGATAVFTLALGWATGVSRAYTVVFWLMLLMLLQEAGNAGGVIRFPDGPRGWLFLGVSVLSLSTLFLRLAALRGEIARPRDVHRQAAHDTLTIPWLTRWSERGSAPYSSQGRSTNHADLFRLGWSAHDPAKLGAALTAVALLGHWALSALGGSQGSETAITILCVLTLVFLPPLSAAVYLSHRWPRLGCELLRPVRREQAARHLILGVFRDAATLWFWAAGSTLSVLLIVERHNGLENWADWRSEASNMAQPFAVGGAMALLTTSIVVYLAPARSFLLLIVVSIGFPMAIVIGNNLIGEAALIYQPPVRIFAASCPALAFVILYLAHRRWRQVEWG